MGGVPLPVRRHGKTWEARVQFAGRRFSRSFARRSDAFEWERRTRGQIEDSRVGRAPSRSLEEAIHRWLTGEASTLRSYSHIIKHVRTIYPYAKGRELGQVVEVAELLKSEAIKKKQSPATVNRKLAILRRVARLAYRQWGWLDQPIGDRITLLTGEKQRHVFLTPEQVKKLAKHASKAVRNAIILAALTGLRRGELLSLGPESVQNATLVLKDTKNGRPRVVPLPQEIAGIRLPIGISANTLESGFQKARRLAGMPHVRFHDLRHTYASWLIQSGAGLTVVRDLLGHSSLAVTSRYSHLAQDHLREAVKGLPRGLSGRTMRKKHA